MAKNQEFRKKYRSYSDEDKYSILRILKKNNYNYKITSKETGVAQSTIKNWKNNIGDNIDSALPVVQAAVRTEQTLGEISLQYIRKNYNSLDKLTGLVVSRITELIPTETDLGKLNNTLKVLVDFVGKLQDTKREDNGSATNNVVNLIQQSITQLNMYQKEQQLTQREINV